MTRAVTLGTLADGRRLPRLRRVHERRPAGLLHAHAHRHRPAPRHPRRRRQLARGRAAHAVGARRSGVREARRHGRPQADAAHLDRASPAVAALVLPFTDSFCGVPRRRGRCMGFYVVWLPLEIALIWSRSRRMEGRSVITARAAGLPRRRARDAAPSSARSSAARSSTSLPLTIVLLVPAVLIVDLLLRHPVRSEGVAGADRRPVRHRRPRPHLARAHRLHRRPQPAAPRRRTGEPLVVGGRRARRPARRAVRALGAAPATTRSSTCGCSAPPPSARSSSPPACSA